MLMCCETLAICQRERGREGKTASQRESAQRGGNIHNYIIVDVYRVLKNICSSEQQEMCATKRGHQFMFVSIRVNPVAFADAICRQSQDIRSGIEEMLFEHLSIQYMLEYHSQ